MYDLPDRAEKEKGRFVVTPEVVRKESSLFDTPPLPITKQAPVERPAPDPAPRERTTAAERKKESA
jgi:hypothetical protein